MLLGVPEAESDEEQNDVEVGVLGLVRFGEEFFGGEIEKCRASKGEDRGQHGAAGVSEERCSADSLSTTMASEVAIGTRTVGLSRRPAPGARR